MTKNIGALAVVVVLVVLAVLFWALRGRPAGESAPAGTAFPPIESPADTTGAEITAPESATIVSVTEEGFVPATVSVATGGTVTFRNDDQAPHQIASDPHPVHTNYPTLNGPVLNQGEVHAVIFSPGGTYRYHDHLNPGLTGTVTTSE